MADRGSPGGKKVPSRVAAMEKARRVRMASVLGAVAAVAVVAVLVVAIAPAPMVPAGTADCTSKAAGQDACPFTVSFVNRPATFDLAGITGPLLIDFMGSHCTTCEAEMPHLNEVAGTYRPRGLTMVSLDVGGALGTEDPQDAVDFMARNGGEWDIALDNDAIAIDYGVVTLPTLFLVDSTGKIVYRTGFISAEKLSEQIEPLL